jgi:hypothetical protein
MGILTLHNVGFSFAPPLPVGTKVALDVSPASLYRLGFNIPVEILTASLYRKPPVDMPLSSITVMAHFDTGASITSIDISLAKYLNLISTGTTEIRTASGHQVMSNFAIDVSFPNSNLSPFHNLHISSCILGFDLEKNKENQNDPRNFGLLIGRDIMSRWTIVWNGPSSTVIISD